MTVNTVARTNGLTRVARTRVGSASNIANGNDAADRRVNVNQTVRRGPHTHGPMADTMSRKNAGSPAKSHAAAMTRRRWTRNQCHSWTFKFVESLAHSGYPLAVRGHVALCAHIQSLPQRLPQTMHIGTPVQSRVSTRSQAADAFAQRKML